MQPQDCTHHILGIPALSPIVAFQTWEPHFQISITLIRYHIEDLIILWENTRSTLQTLFVKHLTYSVF